MSKINDEVGAAKYPCSPAGASAYLCGVAISASEACVSKTNDEVGAAKYPCSPAGASAYLCGVAINRSPQN